MEPLVISIMQTLERSVAHMAQPIHKDTPDQRKKTLFGKGSVFGVTPAPSHAMLYTYIAADYTQSSLSTGNQCNSIKAHDIESGSRISPELQYVQLRFEPLASQKQYI